VYVIVFFIISSFRRKKSISRENSKKKKVPIPHQGDFFLWKKSDEFFFLFSANVRSVVLRHFFSNFFCMDNTKKMYVPVMTVSQTIRGEEHNYSIGERFIFLFIVNIHNILNYIFFLLLSRFK